MNEPHGLSEKATVLLTTAAWLGPDPLPPGLPQASADTMEELAGQGMLVRHQDGGHSLPEEARRKVRATYGTRGRDEAILALGDFLGQPGSPSETARCLFMLPHLMYWTEQTRPEDDFPAGAMIVNRTVVLLLENDMGAKAVPLAQRFVRTCEAQIGRDAPATLTARSNLAAAHDQAGESLRGARLLEKVVEARIAALGADHPSVWDGYNNLSGSYLRAGEYERAQQIVERLIEHRTETLGPRDRATLMARNNLAVIWERAGRTAEAVALWQEIFPMFEAALGAGDSDTLAIGAALYQARQSLQEQHVSKEAAQRDRAEDLAEIEQRVAHLSADPEQISLPAVAALVELATALRDTGRLDEAEAAFTEAIDKGRGALGDGHPVVVSARYRLVHIYRLRGHTDVALAAARAALAEAERSLGRTHYETLITAANVICLVLEGQQMEEHEELLEDRLADIIEGLGFTHPLVRALAAYRASLTLRQPDWRR
ncbi:tetratricopeptide repeat protein [Streptomyces sp. NPDC088810]|uniref:tetratricopeptide repeat protein n=1 Tax=Streptomyces sp. NPDC088810 TaxID=3365904 RepID=UPI0037F4DB0B